jgi:predicted permease
MKDFGGPDMEDEEVKEALRLKQQRWLLIWKQRKEDGRTSGRRPTPEGLIEEGKSKKKDTLEASLHCTLPARRPTFETVEATHEVSEQRANHCLHKHHTNSRCVSFQLDSTDASPTALHTAFNSTIPSIVAHTEDGKESLQSSPIVVGVSNGAPSLTPASLFSKFLFHVRTLPGPVTITIIVSFIISTIPPLKALFVLLKHEDGTPIISLAPDGAPPLSFLLDTATFLGNVSVPLGLICIGAALAKLKTPKRGRDLPLGAISALAFGRLILQPVIAVFMIQGLVRVGVINEEDKVLRFVVM